MLTKKITDHVFSHSPSCGLFKEILQKGEYPAFDLAYTENLQPTKVHFHKNFDEIYYVLDGKLVLSFFDPVSKNFWKETLQANELCIVTKNIHHRVSAASSINRLCVICVPGYDSNDEYLSEIIL